MADINWAADAGSTLSGSATVSSGSIVGTYPLCFDEDFGTIYKCDCGIGAQGTATSTMTIRSVFAKPVTISRLRSYWMVYTSSGDHSVPAPSYSMNIKYRIGAAWTTATTLSGGAANSDPIDTDLTGLSIEGVDAVEWNGYATGSGYRYPMFPYFIVPGIAIQGCYELQAYGSIKGGVNPIFFGANT